MNYFNVAGEANRSYKGVNNKYALIANVANNYIDNQFEFIKDVIFGTTKAKIKKEKETARIQNALSTLSNQQQYVLDLKLQAATSENAKLKIFSETLTTYSGQKFGLVQQKENQLAVIFIVGSTVVLGAILLFKKYN